VLVHTPDEVTKVNPEKDAIRIAHAVGMRKRIQITSLAREREIHILNPLVRRVPEEEEISEELPEDLFPELDEEAATAETQENDKKESEKQPKRSEPQTTKEVNSRES
jgi:hypothetical protein